MENVTSKTKVKVIGSLMIKYVEVTLKDTRVGGTERTGLLQKVAFTKDGKEIDYLMIVTPEEQLMCVRLPMFFIKAMNIVYVGFTEIRDFHNTFMSWCDAFREIKYCLASLLGQGLGTPGGGIDTTRYIGVPEKYKKQPSINRNITYFIQDKAPPKAPAPFFLCRKTEMPTEKELDILAKKLLSIKEGTYIRPIIIDDSLEDEQERPSIETFGRHIVVGPYTKHIH